MISKNNSRLERLEKKLLTIPMFEFCVVVLVGSNKEAVSYIILQPGKKDINLQPDEYEKHKDDLESLNWVNLYTIGEIQKWLNILRVKVVILAEGQKALPTNEV